MAEWREPVTSIPKVPTSIVHLNPDVQTMRSSVVPSKSNSDARSAAEARAHRGFTAVLLQSMVASMMPKEKEKLLGAGSAGEMWKSLLVEKIASEIARSGRFEVVPKDIFAAKAGDTLSVSSQPRTSVVAAPSASGDRRQAQGEEWTATIVRGDSGHEPASGDWVADVQGNAQIGPELTQWLAGLTREEPR